MMAENVPGEPPFAVAFRPIIVRLRSLSSDSVKSYKSFQVKTVEKLPQKLEGVGVCFGEITRSREAARERSAPERVDPAALNDNAVRVHRESQCHLQKNENNS
jgi:hypothetical protein